MYFKLLPKVGSHSETDDKGKLITHRSEDGYVFDTDLDLIQMFPNKFERVQVGPDVPKPPESKKPSKAEEDASNPLGRDVTKRFPKAAEEDFKVFADGGAFFVCESDDPTKALNDKPLKKAQVEKFVEEYLA